MTNNKKDNANVVAFPPMIYLGTFILGLILNLLFPLPIPLPRLPFIIIGLALISAAIIIVVSASRAFKKHGTNVNPSLPTTAIVSEGIFRFTRNPIYLAFTLLYVGVALLLNSLWLLLLSLPLLIIINFGVILREEVYLESKFGAEYLDYKKRVRRWL